MNDGLNDLDVYDDLAGVHEVALGLDVKINRVKRWIERRPQTGCPRPVRELRQGNVYSLNEWRGWFALWRITRGSETWTRRVPPAPGTDNHQTGNPQ